MRQPPSDHARAATPVVSIDAVARGLAELGPFFQVRTHHAGASPVEPWHAMSELAAAPDILADRVRAVRERLAAAGAQPVEAVRPRVAASVTHLGLVARLISPALAAAVLCDALVEVSLDSAWWQPTLGGAFPLSLPETTRAVSGVPAAQVAELMRRQVVDGPVRRLTALVERMSVSSRVLWGNVASAIHGAATMLGSARPALAARADLLASHLLDTPPLRGAAETTATGFRRRSCCLIYQAAATPGSFCSDCVIPRRTG